jgi:hypothetical protein
MTHDVFVSYTKNDKVVADSIIATLEKNDIRCYYAPRDIKPGEDWGKAITDAIRDCKIFLLVFSGSSNKSRRVLDELNLAISTEKIVLPFRIENLEPSDAMMLHLTSRHWLDAYSPSWEKHLTNLAGVVASNLDKPIINSEYNAPKKPKIKKQYIYAGAGLAVVALITSLFLIFSGKPDEPEPKPEREIAAVQPLPTDTIEPQPTETELPTPEPTQTPEPQTEGGVREFSTDNMSIMLPDDWMSFDLDEESMGAILTLLEEVDPEMAASVGPTLSSGEMQDMGEFWAMDSKGVANANLVRQLMPMQVESSLLCMMMPEAYQQMGMNVTNSRCGLNVNGMDSALFEIETSVGAIVMSQYQYIYLDNLDMWILTLSVDKSQKNEYRPIFESIAQTFTIKN